MQHNGGITNRPGRVSIMALAAILVVLFLWSCGDDSSTDSTVDDPIDTGLIGPDGGTFVDASSGVTVVVPPGALSTGVALTCTYYADESEIPDNMRSSIFGALGVVCLGPDGLEFDSPVTVTVPVSVLLTPGEQFPLFVWNVANSSWEMTEFTCTASADGQSFSTQVTHFSNFTADNGYGSDGIFGDLEPSDWLDVEAAFSAWYASFCWDLGDNNKKQMGDCCMGVTGLKFTIDYQGSVNYTNSYEEGDLTTPDHLEHYEVTRGTAGSDFYLHLTADVYWSCLSPDFLDVDAFPRIIDLSDEEKLTAEVTAKGGCGDYLMPGVQVQFTVSGPGSVDPTTAITGSDGYARTTYTATDLGTATITGTANTCLEWGNTQMASDTATIEVDSCSGWGLIVLITFDHNPDNFSFHDDITMYIPLTISESGQITSTGGLGAHNASLTTSAGDCSVTHEYTPDFVPGAIGQLTGSNMYLTIAPVSGWALDYTLTCIVDDQPVDIPLPPYNYLLPSIMASQVFNEFPLALEDGASATGSGQDTEWSDEDPITYTYQIVVHCE